jgi:CTP:molybdopterin cytidylyltransferase MocA
VDRSRPRCRSMKIAGLVLAAGGGSRLGRPKAEVVVGGRRLVDLAIGSCARAGMNPVVVVLGAVWLTPMPLADSLDADIPDAPDADAPEIWLVENGDWATGMASSLKAGLAALELDPGIDAVVVTLVDTISVGEQHLRRVGSALKAGAAAVVAPTTARHARRLGSPARSGPTWPQPSRVTSPHEADGGTPSAGYRCGVRRPRTMDRHRHPR